MEILNSREISILRLLCHKDAAIAEKLQISPKYMNYRRGLIYEKLGVTSKCGAIIVALREGIIQLEDFEVPERQC